MRRPWFAAEGLHLLRLDRQAPMDVHAPESALLLQKTKGTPTITSDHNPLQQSEA